MNWDYNINRSWLEFSVDRKISLIEEKLCHQYCGKSIMPGFQPENRLWQSLFQRKIVKAKCATSPSNVSRLLLKGLTCCSVQSLMAPKVDEKDILKVIEFTGVSREDAKSAIRVSTPNVPFVLLIPLSQWTLTSQEQ